MLSSRASVAAARPARGLPGAGGGASPSAASELSCCAQPSPICEALRCAHSQPPPHLKRLSLQTHACPPPLQERQPRYSLLLQLASEHLAICCAAAAACPAREAPAAPGREASCASDVDPGAQFQSPCALLDRRCAFDSADEAPAGAVAARH